MPLTGNEGTEADMERALVVDQELLLQGEETSTSYEQETFDSLKLLLAGASAGGVSKSATAPLARLTILYQVQGLPTGMNAIGKPSRLRVSEALRYIVREEGVRALWKGNGVTIIHRLPYSGANFWTYEQVNELWKTHVPPEAQLALGDVTRRLAAGGAAGLTACTLAYPLDLVRTRLAAQSGRHQGIRRTLAGIVQQEGARGLYRGLGATLAQVAPSLAINYAAYETLRSMWLESSDRHSPTVPMSLACGSAAGLVSSTATFPLDLVRRRLQLGRAAPDAGRSAPAPATYAAVVRQVVAAGGLRGLYAGIIPEYMKVIPGVAIAFATYELAKKTLHVQTNSTDR